MLPTLSVFVTISLDVNRCSVASEVVSIFDVYMLLPTLSVSSIVISSSITIFCAVRLLVNTFEVYMVFPTLNELLIFAFNVSKLSRI